MKQIVDQILDLSKMKLNKFELNLTQTNLSEILQKIHTSFLPLFTEKSIEFELNVPENISIIGDTVYLERAINNIILNSLKYTEKGQVTLSTTIDHNDMVSLCISDTGIGIKEAELKKVFLEFYQADNEINFSGGSGIGLSFSKNILELHGGNIEIQSKHGEGTNLTLTIPSNTSLHPTELKPIAPISNQVQKYNSPKVGNEKSTILIVEDHSEMMNYLNVLLSDNYQIVEAKNGLEAIDQLEKEKIDFIVTDYMMPKMNGGDFIKNIRQKGYTTPVIVLTARTDINTKLDVLRLGVDDYLYKPFNSEELLIKIENKLANYKETNQPLKQEKEETTLLQPSTFISDLTLYVDQNCQKSDFNLEVICLHLGLSKSSLFRKLKTETGLNPQGFIKEVRLLKARRVIENKEICSLKELVHLIGVKNMTYFKKVYFERFGLHIKDQIQQKPDL